MNNFLQTFMTQRKSLIDSVTAQSSFINQLISIIDGDSITAETVTCNLTSITSSLKLENGHLSGTFKDSSDEYIPFDLNLEDVTPETLIPELGKSLASVIADVSDAQNLNCALAQINDAVLNYGEISTQGAIAIVDAYGTSSSSSLQTLKTILSVSGSETIDAQTWQSILYNFNKETAEACDNGDLVLDNSTKVVSAFVGTAILSAISSAIQMIGVVLTKVSTIIGIILMGIGSVLGWLANAVVDTTFEMNYRALNYNLRTPFSAQTLSNFSTNDQYINSGVFAFNKPGFTHYMWRTKLEDSDVTYVNSYFDVSIDYRKVRNELRRNGWNVTSYLTSSNKVLRADFDFTANHDFALTNSGGVVTKYDASNIYDFTNLDITDDDKYHLSYGELLSHDGDKAFWYRQILMAYAVSIVSSVTAYSMTSSGITVHEDDQKAGTSINWITNGSTLTEAPDYSADGIASFAVAFLFASDADQDYIIENYGTNLMNFAVNLSSVLPDIIAIQDGSWSNGYTVNFMKSTTESLSAPYIRSCPALSFVGTMNVSTAPNESVLQLQSNPSKFFINWPDYAPSALLNTLLLVAGVTIIGTAVGLGIRKAFNAWKLRASVRAVEKVKLAKQAFDEDGSVANAKALQKQTNWYNFKAKLFGWSQYDALNDWYDNPSNTNEISNTVNSLVNDVSLDSVIKLIKN